MLIINKMFIFHPEARMLIFTMDKFNLSGIRKFQTSIAVSWIKIKCPDDYVRCG